MCQWVVLCAPKSKRSGQLAHEKAAAHIREVKQMMENSAASWKKKPLLEVEVPPARSPTAQAPPKKDKAQTTELGPCRSPSQQQFRPWAMRQVPQPPQLPLLVQHLAPVLFGPRRGGDPGGPAPVPGARPPIRLASFSEWNTRGYKEGRDGGRDGGREGGREGGAVQGRGSNNGRNGAEGGREGGREGYRCLFSSSLSASGILSRFLGGKRLFGEVNGRKHGAWEV